MTIAAFHQLSIEGADFDMRVERVTIDQALHARDAIEVMGEVVTAGREPAPDAETLIGSRANITLAGELGAELSGVISAVSRHGSMGVTFVIGHPVTALCHTCDHRVFVNADVVAIAEQVLGDHGIQIEARIDQPPEPRMQCVQSFESDLDFLSRILAEEGIAWFVERSADGAGQLVLADHPAAFQPIEGDERLPYGADEGLRAPESVSSGTLRYRLQHDRITLGDSWFENPALDLTATTKAGAGTLEHYAYPGPNRYRDPDRGRQLAGRWLEMLRADTLVLKGVSTCPRLAAGRSFVLHGAPRDDLNRRWLVVTLSSTSRERHGESDASRFEAGFVAVPADLAWRPAITRPPTVGGVQSAVVTGPSGPEIHTDAYGRVKAHLRWDRRSPEDDSSSAWIRVVHPQLSGGFFLPRVGWEVLLGFGGPSGDLPFVLGRLDNGAAPTAESLPTQMRRGNFGTPTTPGGGLGHRLRMDDSAGGEQLKIDASRDYDEQTAANKATTVEGSEARVVSANRDLTYESSHGLTVSACQSITVGITRSVTGNGGMIIDAGSESVTVGGMREVTVGGHCSSKIGGNLSRLVAGAKVVIPLAGFSRHTDSSSTIMVGGGWLDSGASSSISVGGMSSLQSAATSYEVGKLSIESNGYVENSGGRTEKAGGNIALESPKITLNYGATSIEAPTVKVCASSKITLNGGGASIVVTPGTVVLNGPLRVSRGIRSGGDAKTD